MHSIHISIGSYNNIIISETFQPFFNIQCMLQKVKLLIFINNFFCQAETIERLSPETENRLCFYVSCLGDRSTCAVTFGNKNGALFLFCKKFFFPFGRWLIIEMIAAVPQFFIMKIRFFGSFIC